MRAAALLLGLALAFPALGADPGKKWSSFVVHVNQGPVDEHVRGGKCTASVRGCARRRPSPPGAWLDGECWITIPVWEPTPGAMSPPPSTWAHELGHCTDGAWHE